MKPKYKLMLMIVCLLDASTVFAAKERGGGSYLVCKGRSPVLVDLAVETPKFEDDFSRMSERKLKATRVSRALGFDYIHGFRDEKNHAAIEVARSFALERLENWKESSPRTFHHLESAMKSLPIGVTEAAIQVQPDYVLPDADEFKNCSVHAAILYGSAIGAAISIPAWNTLGAWSQAGLIIHEGLRQLQIRHNMPLSNENLQLLTAYILFYSPSRDFESLDTPRIWPEPFLNPQWTALIETTRNFQTEIYEDYQMKLSERTLALLEKVNFPRNPEDFQSKVRETLQKNGMNNLLFARDVYRAASLNLLNWADSISRIRSENFQTLTAEDQRLLQELFYALLNLQTDFVTRSVSDRLDSMLDAIKALETNVTSIDFLYINAYLKDESRTRSRLSAQDLENLEASIKTLKDYYRELLNDQILKN